MESTNPKDKIGKLKPDLSLIPPVANLHESLAMMDGSRKYGPYNWRKTTVSAMVYLSACMRHLGSLVDGEDYDPDSKAHHAGHARACLGIFLDAFEQGTLVDDRPKGGKAAEVIRRFTTKVGQIARSGAWQRVLDAEPGEVVPMTQADVDALSPPNGFVGSVLTPTPRKRKVYISGPMGGKVKHNFPAFDEARDLAMEIGFSPISPADIDRQNGIFENTVVDRNPATMRDFFRRDTRALESLRAEDGDAIALLPGWHESTGAVAEFFCARWLGLAVLDAETMEPFEAGNKLGITAGTLGKLWEQAARDYIDSHSEGLT